MNIRVKLFAMVRDIVGKDEVSLAVPRDATASSVVSTLVQQFPGLEGWKQYVRIAVNWEYAGHDEQLHENDEVAIIPPVSGG